LHDKQLFILKRKDLDEWQEVNVLMQPPPNPPPVEGSERQITLKKILESCKLLPSTGGGWGEASVSNNMH